MKEMNRFYIDCQLNKDKKVSFIEYLHPGEFKSDKDAHDFLTKTFVRATLAEKRELSENHELQKHFISMMLTITKAAAGHVNLVPGYRGTLTGFLIVFKETLLEKLPIEITRQLVDLVALIPTDIYEEQSFVVNGMIKRVFEKTKDREEIVGLEAKIAKFTESSAKSHLLELIR